MQTIGNDFVLLDNREQHYVLPLDERRRLADRHFGIGCDQLLVLEPSQQSTALCHYRVFNADGNEVEQCGNGVRCIARYLFDYDDITSSSLTLTCQAGEIVAERSDNNQISINMGVANWQPTAVGLTSTTTCQRHYTVTLPHTEVTLAAVALGNPHAVIIVEKFDLADIDTIGEQLNLPQQSPFSQGVNVGFMRVLSPQHIELIVYERGVGRTYGCGSGACAATVAGQRFGQLAQTVRVTLPGGDLQVSCRGADAPIWLQGDAQYVFKGSTLT